MTRLIAAAAVLAVAVVAAVISYGHVEVLALTNGQGLLAARCLPVSIDGLVVAASMVLLDYARRGIPAPALARVLLGLGVTATLAANAAAGASHGAAGIAVSMWPAVAFIGAAEAFLMIVRGSRQEATSADETVPEGVPGPVQEAPVATRRPPKSLSGQRSPRRGDTPAPADVFAQGLSAGVVPGIRAIKSRCHVGQDAAVAIKSELAAFLSDRPAIVVAS